MSKYFFHITNHEIEMIYRTDDCAWIPPDPANMDYQQYLAWVAEGNTPEPWEPETTIADGSVEDVIEDGD